MYDQLRKALIAVCKRFADGCAIDEAELNYLRKELKRFTGALKDDRDHELFMNIFNFGTIIHDMNPGRRNITFESSFGTIGDNKEHASAQSDPFFDYKSYPQEKKIKLLQVLTQELLALLIENKTNSGGFLVHADKMIKDLRILFRLVPHTSWHNEEDKKSVLDDLYIIYSNLDSNGWEAPLKQPSGNIQKGIKQTTIDSARKLVEKVRELAPENVFRRTLIMSGKCFASGLRFFKSKAAVVPVEVKSNVLHIRPGKSH